jgi:2-polyprenyl-3-methyl-5-hydroxy-6-metoxy-1,4-benzoquinol methylase
MRWGGTLPVNCLLCGNTATPTGVNVSGYQESQTFAIYHCRNCNTSFSIPRCDANYIYELIYRHGDKVRYYDRYYKYFNEVKEQEHPLQYLAESEVTYWGIKDFLSKIEKPKELVTIIEVGCGLGYLTYSLKKEGYNVIGIDISKNAVEKAIEKFGNHYVCVDVNEYAKEHKDEYDIIISTEVIEHIEKPIIILKSFMYMLKQDGKILLTTPNKTIFKKNAIWRTDLPPVHIWWFSEKSIKYIASQIDAEVDYINYSDYYSKKPDYIDLSSPVDDQSAVFNKDGGLIRTYNEDIKNKDSGFKRSKTFLKKLPFFKYFYIKFIKNNFICKKRGYVLGIILQKRT